MRTRQQERARYNWLTPREFGELAGGQGEESVRELIRAGWFGVTDDGEPECVDVRRVGGKRAEYRIQPSAVNRFLAERAVTGKAA